MTTKASGFKTRNIVVTDEERRTLAINLVKNVPLGVEIIARKYAKIRTLDQSAMYFAGPIKDISDQAWIDGKQFSKEAIHEHCKREFLPENDDPELEELVKNVETYRKWTALPNGTIVCTGSTTELTTKGFSRYLDQVHALGAGLGVMFSARM